MIISFIAYGTRGDVQPVLAVGRALRARGHQVRVLASSHFKSWIESNGLAALPAAVDIQAVMNSALGQEWAEVGTQPYQQLRVMKRLADTHGLTLIQQAWQGCQGSDLIVSSGMSMNYGSVLARALQARHAIMLVQPPTMASRSGPATLNAPVPRRDSWINYLYGKWLLAPVTWWAYGAVINHFRRESLGLAPQTQAENIADWQAAPILVGISPQVVAPPGDWPPNVHVTGYWFLEAEPEWTPPARLADFLATGPPPVCIGFGSMVGRRTEAFNHLLAEAVRQSGQRAVVLAGWASLGGLELPGNSLTLDAAPHGWLFPQVAAVVHHGGAGTAAAAFLAGVPQVVVPHLADHPFWGQRVEHLGVGPRAIPRPRLTAGNLSASIRAATADEGMRQRAATLGQRLRAEDGVAAAVALLERANR